MQFTSFQKFVAFVLFCFLLFLAMVSSDQADLLSKSFPSLSVLLKVALWRITLSNMSFLPILFSPQDSGVVISNFLSHYVETVSFLFFFCFEIVVLMMKLIFLNESFSKCHDLSCKHSVNQVHNLNISTDTSLYLQYSSWEKHECHTLNSQIQNHSQSLKGQIIDFIYHICVLRK